MRNAILLLLALLALGCGKPAVEKPDNLIDQQTMANIIYDLAVIEAMKTQDVALIGNASSDYVYKKYKVDSLRFVRSNQYYAAQIDQYKKIYEKVDARLAAEKNTADSIAKKTRPMPKPASDVPQVK